MSNYEGICSRIKQVRLDWPRPRHRTAGQQPHRTILVITLGQILIVKYIYLLCVSSTWRKFVSGFVCSLRLLQASPNALGAGLFDTLLLIQLLM